MFKIGDDVVRLFSQDGGTTRVPAYWGTIVEPPQWLKLASHRYYVKVAETLHPDWWMFRVGQTISVGEEHLRLWPRSNPQTTICISAAGKSRLCGCPRCVAP